MRANWRARKEFGEKVQSVLKVFSFLRVLMLNTPSLHRCAPCPPPPAACLHLRVRLCATFANNFVQTTESGTNQNRQEPLSRSKLYRRLACAQATGKKFCERPGLIQHFMQQLSRASKAVQGIQNQKRSMASFVVSHLGSTFKAEWPAKQLLLEGPPGTQLSQLIVFIEQKSAAFPTTALFTGAYTTARSVERNQIFQFDMHVQRMGEPHQQPATRQMTC